MLCPSIWMFFFRKHGYFSATDIGIDRRNIFVWTCLNQQTEGCNMIQPENKRVLCIEKLGFRMGQSQMNMHGYQLCWHEKQGKGSWPIPIQDNGQEMMKWRFPKIGAPPKSRSLVGFSIVHHPAMGHPYSRKPPNGERIKLLQIYTF